MFKNSFGYLVKEGLHNIRANRQMSVASIGVLIACMVLIGGALLLSLNINSLMGYVESFNEVVVWIDDDLGSAGTERLKAEIDDLPNIASKQYISKEDALKEMTQGGFGESSHHKDGAAYLMKADIPKLRAALSSGACSTSPFASCVVMGWLKSA